MKDWGENLKNGSWRWEEGSYSGHRNKFLFVIFLIELLLL